MSRESFQWYPQLFIASQQGNATAQAIINESRAHQEDAYFDGPTHKEEVTRVVEAEIALFPRAEIYLVGSRADDQRRSLRIPLYSDTDLLVVCTDADAQKPEFNVEEIRGTANGIHIIRLSISTYNRLRSLQQPATSHEEEILHSIAVGPKVALFPPKDPTILARTPLSTP